LRFLFIHILVSLIYLPISASTFGKVDKAVDFNQFVEQNLNKGYSGLVNIVDSLFELKTLDPKIIGDLQNKIDSFYTFFYDSKIHEKLPAEALYDNWNTKFSQPYDVNKMPQDSIFVLPLVEKGWLCNFVIPFQGEIISPYGWRGNRMHRGVDIKLNIGDPVVSSFKGVVRYAKDAPGFGLTVIVRHHNGLETIYSHLSKISVEPGEFVEPGQLVGLGGNTGRTTTSHLHFEIRFKGIAFDPQSFIDFNNSKLRFDVLQLQKSSFSLVPFLPNQKIHVLKNGDTVESLAKQYNVTTNQICNWNAVKRDQPFVSGEIIRVSE
jgi:murein DD-endopeptidase MepM/ murein hydrolase activator NlpD